MLIVQAGAKLLWEVRPAARGRVGGAKEGAWGLVGGGVGPSASIGGWNSEEDAA